MTATSSDPGQSYGYQARGTHRAFDRLLQRRLGKHGVPNGYWYVLRVLWEREGLSQRELSAAMNLTESSTVTLLSNMEADGLVRRRRHPRDRRRLRVHPTPKARRMKARLLPLAFEINALAARGIEPADLETYLQVCHRMRANLMAALEQKQDGR